MVLVDLLYVLFIILTIPFWVRYLFRKKYRKILKNRFIPALAPQAGKTIWIHAVSVGEARSLKSLIHELVHQCRKKVVLTVTTPTGYEFASREYEGITVIPAPLDFSFAIKRFVRAINPEVLLFNELDLWPNWIYVVKRQAIPMMLINGRISEIAFKKYALFSHLVGRFLNRLEVLIVQTATYKERFQRLKIPAERIVLCGNIKADEALQSCLSLPPGEQVYEMLGLRPEKRRTIVIASSHRNDEKLVIPAIAAAKNEWQFILVPRHPERVPEIAAELERHRIQFRFLTHPPSSLNETSVLVIDRVGLLFDIISIADVVFMGGTCSEKVGGHNLYEPAAQGKWIIGGPHFQNFADIGKDLTECGVYQIVKSSKELLQVMETMSRVDLERIGKAAVAEVQKRRGSVQCILKQIQRVVQF